MLLSIGPWFDSGRRDLFTFVDLTIIVWDKAVSVKGHQVLLVWFLLPAAIVLCIIVFFTTKKHKPPIYNIVRLALSSAH